jgi:hypothetical protein
VVGFCSLKGTGYFTTVPDFCCAVGKSVSVLKMDFNLMCDVVIIECVCVSVLYKVPLVAECGKPQPHRKAVARLLSLTHSSQALARLCVTCRQETVERGWRSHTEILGVVVGPLPSLRRVWPAGSQGCDKQVSSALPW